MTTTELQRCPRCRRDLPTDAYAPSRRGKPGVSCRGCDTARQRKAVPRVAADDGAHFAICGHPVERKGWCSTCFLVDERGVRVCSSCRTSESALSAQGYCSTCIATLGAAPLSDFRPGASHPCGFAVLTAEQRQDRARQGGQKAHEAGKAHRFTTQSASAAGRIPHERGTAREWTPEEARRLGRLGGSRTHRPKP